MVKKAIRKDSVSFTFKAGTAKSGREWEAIAVSCTDTSGIVYKGLVFAENLPSEKAEMV